MIIIHNENQFIQLSPVIPQLLKIILIDGAFINHVDMAGGGGVYQISILLQGARVQTGEDYC